MKYTIIIILAISLIAAGIFLIIHFAYADKIDLPANFAAVDKDNLDGYKVRGISADGVVIALRSEDNPENGTLDFWTKAIENEVTGRGYKLTESEKITSNAGQDGMMMTFSTDILSESFTYITAIYVKSKQVLVVEAGGKADAVKEHLPALQKAILSVR